MKFLSKQCEELLKLSIDNSENFPNVLCEKLSSASEAEDGIIRDCIDTLCDDDYILISSWYDNLPKVGRIKQKGYAYFETKDIFLRKMLREDPCFNLLDEESEEYLQKLYDESSPIFGSLREGKILEELSSYGYIKLGKKGVSLYSGDKIIASFSITKRGEIYFQDKNNRIEELILFGGNKNTTNVEKQYNMIGNNYNGSAVQIGDNNNQEVNFYNFQENLENLKNDLSSHDFTDEYREKIDRLLEELEDNSKRRNLKKIKAVLYELRDVLKQAGAGFLAGSVLSFFGLQ